MEEGGVGGGGERWRKEVEVKVRVTEVGECVEGEEKLHGVEDSRRRRGGGGVIKCKVKGGEGSFFFLFVLYYG